MSWLGCLEEVVPSASGRRLSATTFEQVGGDPQLWPAATAAAAALAERQPAGCLCGGGRAGGWVSWVSEAAPQAVAHRSPSFHIEPHRNSQAAVSCTKLLILTRNSLLNLFSGEQQQPCPTRQPRLRASLAVPPHAPPWRWSLEQARRQGLQLVNGGERKRPFPGLGLS